MQKSWIGFNAARTQDGRPQADGAVALLFGGRIYSLAEERLSRRKHDGDVWRALRHGLDAFGLSIGAIGCFVISTCGEAAPDGTAEVPLRADGRLALQSLDVDPSIIKWVRSHHESHAWEVLHASEAVGRLALPALVVVADRVGQPGEHQSAYLFDGSGLTLIWRSVPNLDMLSGFGEVYDRVTRHLGWQENFDAGKTMALAGCSPTPAKERRIFFDVSQGQLFVRLPADDSAACAMLEEVCPPNPSSDMRLSCGAKLAAQLQSELEDALTALVAGWVAAYGPRMLLFGGGLATNCKLLGRVALAFPKLLVQGSLAPGDTGQGIGNLVGEIFRTSSQLIGRKSGQQRSAFWPGPFSGRDITVEGERRSDFRSKCDPSTVSWAAEALLAGSIVAVCEGDLEPGPRALGFHSLLADARDPASAARLNTLIKFRESFRPFGALLTRSAALRWFGSGDISPYMDLALPAPQEFRSRYPAVIHLDGTTRIQVLSPITRSSFSNALMEYLEARYGINVIINTSLNRSGEPMVALPSMAASMQKSAGVRLCIITD